MNRLANLHPLQVIAICTAATVLVGLLTHDFWLMLVVWAAGIPVLRRSTRLNKG